MEVDTNLNKGWLLPVGKALLYNIFILKYHKNYTVVLLPSVRANIKIHL